MDPEVSDKKMTPDQSESVANAREIRVGVDIDLAHALHTDILKGIALFPLAFILLHAGRRVVISGKQANQSIPIAVLYAHCAEWKQLQGFCKAAHWFRQAPRGGVVSRGTHVNGIGDGEFRRVDLRKRNVPLGRNLLGGSREKQESQEHFRRIPEAQRGGSAEQTSLQQAPRVYSIKEACFPTWVGCPGAAWLEFGLEGNSGDEAGCQA